MYSSRYERQLRKNISHWSSDWFLYAAVDSNFGERSKGREIWLKRRLLTLRNTTVRIAKLRGGSTGYHQWEISPKTALMFWMADWGHFQANVLYLVSANRKGFSACGGSHVLPPTCIVDDRCARTLWQRLKIETPARVKKKEEEEKGDKDQWRMNWLKHRQKMQERRNGQAVRKSGEDCAW
jgi:hypothetical protein